MTFEEFEKAKNSDLKREAKECFEKGQAEDLMPEIRAAMLLEGQFYMSELDRRSGSGIALRDLILEVVVIILIGAEIVLALKQGVDQDTFMNKQNTILTNLQKSTSDTAKAMGDLAKVTAQMSQNTSASAQTLSSLYSTTETMNKGVHDQIALFYDPSIALMYLMDQNRILFQNTGRSSLTLTSLKVNDEVKNVGGNKLIPASTSVYVEVVGEYKAISAQIPKGYAKNVPVEAHIQTELGKHFIMLANLYFIWEGDKVNVHAQTLSVVAEP